MTQALMSASDMIISRILKRTVLIRMTSRSGINEGVRSENVGKPPVWQGVFEERCVYQGVGHGRIPDGVPLLIFPRSWFFVIRNQELGTRNQDCRKKPLWSFDACGIYLRSDCG